MHATERPPPFALSAAERMRATRERRRAGLRIVPFEVRETEIDLLVCRGLLQPAQKQDRMAIAVALGDLLDQFLKSEAPMEVPQ